MKRQRLSMKLLRRYVTQYAIKTEKTNPDYAASLWAHDFLDFVEKEMRSLKVK